MKTFSELLNDRAAELNPRRAKLAKCDSCLGLGNLEPDSAGGEYETCEDCNGLGLIDPAASDLEDFRVRRQIGYEGFK